MLMKIDIFKKKNLDGLLGLLISGLKIEIGIYLEVGIGWGWMPLIEVF